MKSLIINNLPTILMLSAFFFYVVYLIIKGKWEQLRALAYKLILQAERIITGTKMGQERFNLVFEEVYSRIPYGLQIFFPRSTVKERLQEWYNDLKDYLDNGKLDKSL